MENDFVVNLNDLQINCNKNFVRTNFPEFCQSINPSANQISIEINEGNDFYEITKDIFQGKNYEITNDNFFYLFELTEKIKSSRLQTKLNSFEYKNECDNNQIDQHPAIQFLVEVSTLIRNLNLSNYEDYSTQIKQKLNFSNSNNSKNGQEKNESGDNSENDEENSEQDENEDESDEESEEEKFLSLRKIGIKELNKLFYFEIVNTLSTGFSSIEELHEHQNKVSLIIQLIKELDKENQITLKSKETNYFLDSFIDYVIKKYSKIRNQKSSLINFRQETQYLIYYMLLNKMIKLSQIFEENSSAVLYFLEFFPDQQIKDFFATHQQLIEFLKNELKEINIKTKTKTKTRGKKKHSNKEDENKDDIFIDLLSDNIQNGLLQENDLISIMLNDNIEKFKESFTNETIDSYRLPKEISDVSCLSALNNCSLIELSAFFGSQKIFEYLNEKRLNQEIKEIPNLPFYVISSQDPKIIKTFISQITSENRNLISRMLSFCNDHHFNDTYDMIISTIDNCPERTYKEIDQYMKRCVSRSYFDMIPSLLKAGATTNVLLNLFCRTSNEIGIEYILEFSHIDVNKPYKDEAPLECCIRNKNGRGCVLLLKNDYINTKIIDDKLSNGETLIHTVCQLGLAQTVSYLLRKHLYDVNLPTEDGVCPIHFACESGNYDTVLAVIRTKKAHIRTKVKNGKYKKRTALHFACISGNSKIITLLLDSDDKFNVDELDCKERTPIIYAIKGDFVDCIYALLEQEGIDINQEYKGNNLLQYACLKNKNNAFDVLLDSIVFDQNQTCKDGRTILVVAIENKNRHILKKILDKFGRTVNINIETKDGKTPLIKACEMGDIEMVKLIMDHELIKINKATSDGFTPLMAAARSGNSDLLKLLLENEDIDIYAKNNLGMTAIHFAFFSEHIESVKLLLPLFEDKLNDITAKGETLFQIAYKKDKVQLTKLLIDHPVVDVNVRDSSGMTALLTGAETGNIDLIKALIECNKCDLNQKTMDGKNAFLIAIQKQNYDLVKFFIDLYVERNKNVKPKSRSKKKQIQNDNTCVDITAKTNFDMTPLFLALKVKNKRILLELMNCPYIDINETSKDRTFLCKLVKKMCNNNSFGFNYKDIFDVVLERDDVDIKMRSRRYENQNILHIACKSQNHNIKLVKRILELNKIDINSESPEGTPLYLLIKYQSEYFIEKPKVQNNTFAFNFNTRRQPISLNKMVDILKDKAEYSEDEEETVEEDSKITNKNSNEVYPSNMGTLYSNNSCSTTNTSSNSTSTTENYWFDFLDLPKLNVNKGGNSNYYNSNYHNKYNYNNYNNENDNSIDKIEINESPLQLAISRNYTKIAQALVGMKGVDININNNSSKRTPLHLAINNCDVDLIEKIIAKKDTRVNIQDIYGDTPLLLAIKKNSNKLTDFILNFIQRYDVSKGINVQDNSGTSPFLASISNPYSQIFNTLLTLRGVDLKCKNSNGCTGLHLLVNNHNSGVIKDVFDRIKSLIEKCPSLLNIMNNSDKTALFTCFMSLGNYRSDIYKKLYDIISYLLDQDGIDLTIPEELYPDDQGEEEEKNEKPKSKKKKSTKIVERPKYVGTRYTSLLHIACSKSIPDIVEKLIPLEIIHYEENDKKENVFVQKDVNGNTVLNVACNDKDVNTIDVIIKYIKDPENNINYNDPEEFDINTQSSNDLAPLHVICSIDETPKSLIVLEDILSIDSIDMNAIAKINNKTALHFACLNNNPSVVEKLITFGASSMDPNIYNNDKMTPLLIAVSDNRKDIVNSLLKLETIDVNSAIPKIGKTPLYIACENNNEEIVTLLLSDKRTDPNIILPNSGKTPLYVACENVNEQIVTLLLGDERTDPNVPLSSSGKTSLYVACEKDDRNIVTLLLNDERTDPNCRTLGTESTPLIHVVQQNNKDLFDVILSYTKIDINCYDSSKNTALHYACKNTNKLMVDELINYKHDIIDPNIPNSESKTPLIIAVSKNSSPIVKRLLKIESIDVNSCIHGINKCPLYIACEQWNIKIASHLLNDPRTDPNCQIFPSGKTSLMYSIEKYKADLLRIILDNDKIDLDVVDNEKLTAFHYACRIGQLEFIKKIFDKKNQIGGGINIHDYLNAQTEDGFTPLHYACKSNNKEAIMFFLDMNADGSNQIDINIRNKSGLTPFDIYINNPSGTVDQQVYDTFLSESKKEKIETNANFQKICDTGRYKMIDFMISHLSFDANFNENPEKLTPLHILCQNQKIDLIKELLLRSEEFNIDMNALDIYNKTPLHHAVISSFDAEIVKLLLNTNQCDINAKDNSGKTALHYACETGKATIIEELLLYKDIIDINAQDSNGSTILHSLAQSGVFDVNVLRLLLNSDCKIPIDPNLEDKNGNTPLHLACMKENNLFVSSLIDLSPVEINVNAVNNSFQTPFFIVCMNNDSILYSTLFSSKLGHEIDVNLTSPIYIAAIKSHLFLFERMLELPGIDLKCNTNEMNLVDQSENGTVYNRKYKFDGINLLHVLSKYDSPNLLKKLIQLELFDINEKSSKDTEYSLNGTPLIVALKNNQLNNLYLLFEFFGSTLDLSTYDSSGKAAIHYCLQLSSNDINILQELLKIDNTIINMETKDSNRSTPLMIAFQKNKIDSALLLLQQPAIDVFCINKNQNSIVHLAATQSRKDVIDEILAKIKNSTNHDLQDIVEFINIDNDEGETALLIACKRNSIYFVRTLIDTFKDSLDFTICDNEGITPFVAAVKSKNNELINLLLRTVNCISTIDLTVPINEDNDYIAHLMVMNSDLQNFKLLIEETSSNSSNLDIDFVNVQNKKGQSLITLTIQNNKYDFFEYICETQNPDLSYLIDGYTPLIFKVVQSYDYEFLRSIINYGSFNINQKFNGKSLLHYAVESSRDSYDKVEFLIKQKDIDVNCQTDKTGLTPLHLAVKNKNTSIIRLLLSLDDKIDVDKENSRHSSPRTMARNKMIRNLFYEYDSRIRILKEKRKKEEEEEEEEKEKEEK